MSGVKLIWGNYFMSQESPLISCNSILHLLEGTSEIDLDLKSMMVHDLLSKSYLIEDKTARDAIILRALRYTVPEYFSPLISMLKDEDQAGLEEQPTRQKEMKHYDVLIMTVIPNEFWSLKKALDLPEDSNLELARDEVQFWETEIRNDKIKRNLRCLVSMIGDARNVNAALTVSTAMKYYDIGLAVLVGIAAGPEIFVKVGDVIIGNQIIDYEGNRIEPTGPQKRPEVISIDGGLFKQISYFLARDEIMDGNFANFYRPIEEELLSVKLPKSSKINIKRAPILAGEKLIADHDTLQELIDKYHQEARAAEMESIGFALACENPPKIPWLVFRGISDYGNPKKRNQKKYQKNAALSAILALIKYLEGHYSPLNLKEF